MRSGEYFSQDYGTGSLAENYPLFKLQLELWNSWKQGCPRGSVQHACVCRIGALHFFQAGPAVERFQLSTSSRLFRIVDTAVCGCRLRSFSTSGLPIGSGC
jgi:hypothetical protein